MGRAQARFTAQGARKSEPRKDEEHPTEYASLKHTEGSANVLSGLTPGTEGMCGLLPLPFRRRLLRFLAV